MTKVSITSTPRSLPVLTPKGLVPIEQIRVGDYVIATDAAELDPGIAQAEVDEEDGAVAAAAAPRALSFSPAPSRPRA